MQEQRMNLLENMKVFLLTLWFASLLTLLCG